LKCAISAFASKTGRRSRGSHDYFQTGLLLILVLGMLNMHAMTMLVDTAQALCKK
jgi:hypothetical protein